MNSTYTSTNTWAPRISREQARRFPCPKCGAAAGQLCKNEGGGFRGVNHAERAKAIRQAHLINARATVDAIPTEAWNYAKAYLENLGRSSVVTGLTPAEEEIGTRAFTSMNSSTHLLVEHHAKRKSFSEIAAGRGKAEETIARWYEQALTAFAARLTPLVSGSCAACREQMPEIVTNQCLRCLDCRVELDDLWRQRAPVIAAQHHRPLYVIAEIYSAAVRDLAANVTPLLEACCKSCLHQMPDVIFDSTLRCPGCLASLPRSDKPVPNALDVEEFKAACAALGARWTAPTFEIEAAYQKRIKLWNHLIKTAVQPGKRHPHAEDARAKDNGACEFIKSYRAKYGN